MQRDIEVLSEEIQARFRRLKAPLPVDQIEVRKDGRPKPNGPRLYTRFVAYIGALISWERWYSLKSDRKFNKAWGDSSPLELGRVMPNDCGLRCKTPLTTAC